jgi:LDH2 family malate/lactate/ureidoglycolate dehydrogenase
VTVEAVTAVVEAARAHGAGVLGWLQSEHWSIAAAWSVKVSE